METVRAEKDAWARENCSWVPVQRRSKISLLSLGLQERVQAENDGREDASE
jgi:hypothetical protein